MHLRRHRLEPDTVGDAIPVRLRSSKDGDVTGLAESVGADVRARRQVEADRAKPRATARWVTVISASVLVVLALSGTYVEPYRTPVGQVLLVLLLSAYVATLIWMRRMAAGKPLPRFLATRAVAEAMR